MFFKIIVQKKAGIFTAETIKAKSLTQEVPGEKSWGRGMVSKAKSFDGSPDANVISRAIETMNTML